MSLLALVRQASGASDGEAEDWPVSAAGLRRDGCSLICETSWRGFGAVLSEVVVVLSAAIRRRVC